MDRSSYKGVLTPPALVPTGDKPERTAQPRLLVREGAAHAGRPARGPGACPIQRALAGNLEKRNPGPPGLPMPRPSLGGRQWPDSSVTAANWPPVPTPPWGPTADPEGSCGTRPGGDQSWRCSTAQLRVRPGCSGCATQRDARGPSSTRRTVLTATDPRDQSNEAPPLTPSPERVPRVAHAALGCAIPVQG
jgi:hypothetical protein